MVFHSINALKHKSLENKTIKLWQDTVFNRYFTIVFLSSPGTYILTNTSLFPQWHTSSCDGFSSENNLRLYYLVSHLYKKYLKMFPFMVRYCDISISELQFQNVILFLSPYAVKVCNWIRFPRWWTLLHSMFFIIFWLCPLFD